MQNNSSGGNVRRYLFLLVSIAFIVGAGTGYSGRYIRDTRVDGGRNRQYIARIEDLRGKLAERDRQLREIVADGHAFAVGVRGHLQIDVTDGNRLHVIAERLREISKEIEVYDDRLRCVSTFQSDNDSLPIISR